MPALNFLEAGVFFLGWSFPVDFAHLPGLLSFRKKR
jgi:hypothetical protein